jgi:putative hemolysin
MKKANFIIFAIFFLVLVAWIGVFTWDYFASLNEPSLPPSAVDNMNNQNEIANPASVYCENQGGALEIRESEAGQTGYCVFEDGRICEEWALFRDKECVPPQD